MLCLIFNIAPYYRSAIYKAIDDSYECDWYFGENPTDIKVMDTKCLKSCHIVPYKKAFGKFYRLVGTTRRITDGRFTEYIIVGELYNLSVWFILIRNRLFHHKRVFLWSHGYYGKENFMVRILKRIFFGMASGVLLYGNYAKNIMIKAGFNSNKLYVVHNSLDHNAQISLRNSLAHSDQFRQHFGNSNHTLIFIGRITKVKKIELLISAIAELRKRGREYNLVVVGDGDDRSKVETIVEDLGLTKQVWFYGSCYDERINAQLIYDADLCVSPGNVGLTAIHAMTFGTPVISHDEFKYQMPEFEAIKPGKTGDFFKCANIVSLSNCIENWFSRSINREEVRTACYSEIDNFWTPDFQLSVIKKALESLRH